MGDMDNRFGTADEHGKLNREGKLAMIRDGAIECFRVTSRWLLVKVMDQVEGGKMRWQTDMVTEALLPLGARKVDRFDFLTNPRKQPPTRPCTGKKGCAGTGHILGVVHERCNGTGAIPVRQEHALANYTTLFVFRREGR